MDGGAAVEDGDARLVADDRVRGREDEGAAAEVGRRVEADVQGDFGVVEVRGEVDVAAVLVTDRETAMMVQRPRRKELRREVGGDAEERVREEGRQARVVEEDTWAGKG